MERSHDSVVYVEKSIWRVLSNVILDTTEGSSKCIVLTTHFDVNYETRTPEIIYFVEDFSKIFNRCTSIENFQNKSLN